MRCVISYVPTWNKDTCVEKVVFAETCEQAFEIAECFEDVFEIIGLS